MAQGLHIIKSDGVEQLWYFPVEGSAGYLVERAEPCLLIDTVCAYIGFQRIRDDSPETTRILETLPEVGELPAQPLSDLLDHILVSPRTKFLLEAALRSAAEDNDIKVEARQLRFIDEAITEIAECLDGWGADNA